MQLHAEHESIINCEDTGSPSTVCDLQILFNEAEDPSGRITQNNSQ